MINATHLYREIHEQPVVLQKLLEHERETTERLAAQIRQRGITHVVVAARGTSDNAARYAKYLLGAHAGLPVGLATPSLFTIYNQPPTFGNALVLGVSQSGKSPDIVAVLAEARRQGALTATITNIPDSALAQTADFVINLQAGEERSVAATKTYTTELAAIALLCTALKGDAAMADALARLPAWAEQTLALSRDVGTLVERYRYMNRCVVIGRGYNYATAHEIALKLKELTYIMVEPYSSADFMHGPLAIVEQGFPVMVVAPSGVMLPEIEAFIQTLVERQAEVLVISDAPHALALARSSFTLPTDVPEWLSPITAVIPGQLFAMHLASAKDYDPDHPRGLHKVTETR